MLPRNFKVDLSKTYSPKLLNYLREFAKKKGGKCLSEEYIDAKTPLKWQCFKGHIWETAPTNITSGSWCPECARVKHRNINDAVKLAKFKNGEFLSKRFRSTHDKYQWRCINGHIWKTTYSSIQSGTWCPCCAKKKYLNIGVMQKIAYGFGGKCLSKRYKNSSTLLTFKCDKGHIWKTRPQNITEGHWCPKCAEGRRGSSQRLTIQLMQKIANERGGQCLSKVYRNARTKLRWKCKKGHIWKTIPYIVKKGSWCPFCAVKKDK